MEAPKKIYLQVCGDCNANDCENCKFEDLEDNVTWCKDKIFDKDIEYTRTDAFTKKACEGIEHLLSGYIIRNFHFGDSYDIDTLLEDFRKYMEESCNES